MAFIVIDAGHGGFDNGAMYQGRKEKDDNLNLALEVGRILRARGYDVLFTRTADEYQSPYEKAQIANDAGADYFISFHRNSGENDNTYNGVQTLVFRKNTQAERLAQSIQSQLVAERFADLGIEERTGLVVLKRTEMPAVLIETGFINNDKDNRIFDQNFNQIADAIADGVEAVVPLGNQSQELEVFDGDDDNDDDDDDDEEEKYYGVEIGRNFYETSVNYLLEQVQSQGFPAYLYKEDMMYHVIVGKTNRLEEAVELQRKLRLFGYPTMIVYSEMSDS